MGTHSDLQTPALLRPSRHRSWRAWAFLSPLAGLIIAVVLHAAQWATSWIATALARQHGAAEACADLVSDMGSDDIDIVDRAPWGYACEGQFDDGGIAFQENQAGTSTLFFLTLAIVALSLVILTGALLTAIALRVVTAVSPRASIEHGGSRWPLWLLGTGLFGLPMALLAQYLKWYSASKSGGFAICPTSVNGSEVLGFSVTAGYLPPSLTCSGDTVSGEEFSVTQYGFPFYGFLCCLALAALAIVLVAVARLRRRRR